MNNIPPEVLIKLDAVGKTLEQCLKPIHNVGATIYVNICTDVQTTVAWGSVDWLVALLLGGIGLGILGLLGVFIFMVYTDF